MSEQRPSTLAEFVEANHKLLSTVGIFAALTLFSSNLPFKGLGYLLAFVFLSATLLLWVELLVRFPSQRGNWRLVWFENLLSFGVAGLVAYWLVGFRPIWRKGLFFLIGILVASVLASCLSIAIKRHDFFNRLFRTTSGGREGLRHTFYWAFIVFILALSFSISWMITPSLLNWLEAIGDTAEKSFFPPDVSG